MAARAGARTIRACYEQGRIRHIGAFTALEDQMCEFTDLDRSKPKRESTDPSSLGKGGRTSPDRADALVWAFTELLVEEISSSGSTSPSTSLSRNAMSAIWLGVDTYHLGVGKKVAALGCVVAEPGSGGDHQIASSQV